jgi:hypothetical protein
MGTVKIELGTQIDRTWVALDLRFQPQHSGVTKVILVVIVTIIDRTVNGFYELPLIATEAYSL